MKKFFSLVLSTALVVVLFSLSLSAQTLPGVVTGDTVQVKIERSPQRVITRYLPGETKTVTIHDTVYVAVESTTPTAPLISNELIRQSLFGIGVITGLGLLLLGLIAYLLYRRNQQQPQQELPNFAPIYNFAPVFTPTFNPQFNPTTGNIEQERREETPEPEVILVVVERTTTPPTDAAPQGEN